MSWCGAILFLEPLVGFEQTSPLAAERAVVALAAVARLHAAAWEDTELLQGAAERLQRHGGAFALSIRNPKEIEQLQSNWADFVSTFTPHAPELFSRPSIVALGDRLVQWSLWISQQLSPGDAASKRNSASSMTPATHKHTSAGCTFAVRQYSA